MELFCVKPPDPVAQESTLKECKIAVEAIAEPSAFQNEFPPVASARTSDNSASGILRANEPDFPVLSRLWFILVPGRSPSDRFCFVCCAFSL